MQTDQFGERVVLSLKLWWMKLRFALGRVFQLIGIAVVLIGGYALVARSNLMLATIAPISEVFPPNVYTHPLIAFPTGNAILIGVGAVTVWVFT